MASTLTLWLLPWYHDLQDDTHDDLGKSGEDRRQHTDDLQQGGTLVETTGDLGIHFRNYLAIGGSLGQPPATPYNTSPPHKKKVLNTII